MKHHCSVTRLCSAPPTSHLHLLLSPIMTLIYRAQQLRREAPGMQVRPTDVQHIQPQCVAHKQGSMDAKHKHTDWEFILFFTGFDVIDTSHFSCLKHPATKWESEVESGVVSVTILRVFIDWTFIFRPYFNRKSKMKTGTVENNRCLYSKSCSNNHHPSCELKAAFSVEPQRPFMVLWCEALYLFPQLVHFSQSHTTLLFYINVWNMLLSRSPGSFSLAAYIQ